jgi:phage tail-like protein
MPLNPSFSDMLPPPVNYSFIVTFFGIGALGIPNPVDIRFQKVSGIGVNFEEGRMVIQEGSGSERSTVLPGRRTNPKLVLERGLVTGVSPLGIEIKEAISGGKFQKRNILVSSLNSLAIPVTNYLFQDAMLTRWSATDFDADQNQVVIERMDFEYENFRHIGL